MPMNCSQLRSGGEKVLDSKNMHSVWSPDENSIKPTCFKRLSRLPLLGSRFYLSMILCLFISTIVLALLLGYYRWVNNETRTVQSLVDYISDFGGSWSLIDSDGGVKIRKEEENYLEQRLYASFMYQVPAIFKISVLSSSNFPSLQNVSKNYLCLQAGETLIQEDYLANLNGSERFSRYKTAYREFMEQIVQRTALVLSTKDRQNATSKEIKQRLDNILAFEIDLAKLSIQENNGTIDISNKSDKVVWMNATQLNEDFPIFNWSEIFKSLSSASGAQLDEICIENKGFLDELNLIMKKTSRKVINDYICWAMLARFTEYLGSQFKRFQLDFKRKVPDTRFTENQRVFFSRWKECVFYSSRAFKAPASLLYWQRKGSYVSRASKKVKDMIETIKNAVYTIIDNQKWLNDSRVKESIKQRVRQSELGVGFPEYVQQGKIVDELFRSLNIDIDEVFISNWLNLAQHQQILELSRLNQTHGRKGDWLLPPTEANAFYDWDLKLIIVPMGILHEPFISENRPRYLDYSSIGHVLGHEIGHSMDKEQGMENQESTLGINWWPEELKNEYEKRAQCFSNQFSTFKLDEINETVSGNLTLLENICDFVGLQQAYTAWKNLSLDSEVQLPGLTEYTSEQLFFLQFGQIFCELSTEEGYRRTIARDLHAPGEFRVNGVLMNTPQFARAFQCPSGSPMNPPEKCDLFLYDP
ncbi:neprilysin-11-like isoform X2 [Brevipalpus obovatus]|uniref:neprilysin-11-like isoform X2 n=1 Tax=Brevipalpus obovatus TaxID=246614 RepID=UPI003D9E35BC